MEPIRPRVLRSARAAVVAGVIALAVAAAHGKDQQTMNLGTFSLSLAVKDLQASKAFYEKLGFSVIEGQEADHWLVLRNGEAAVGLFQGKFEGNLLTFNPPDVRRIQAALKAQGVTLMLEADATTAGPASAFLKDPDGNGILLDQHGK